MKMFKNQLHHAFKSMTALERSWDNLDSHERATVEQVAQETGFDELGDFEEVVNKFKDFYLQMQKATVIDGYQVYIDSNNCLHIVFSNTENIIDLVKDIKSIIEYTSVPKETMFKILDWYLKK